MTACTFISPIQDKEKQMMHFVYCLLAQKDDGRCVYNVKDNKLFKYSLQNKCSLYKITNT